MDEEKNQEDVVPQETTEEITSENQEVEEEETTEKTPEKLNKELLTAIAQKQHFKEKAEKIEVERKSLEEKLNKLQKGAKPALDVEDYIDISASLEGLDQKEKEYLAQQHKYSGKPLSEIRKNENFLLWQEAYRQKVEREKLALKPSGTQSDAEKPKSFLEKLKSASIEEKEKLLTEAGLYKQVRPRADRVNIGGLK